MVSRETMAFKEPKAAGSIAGSKGSRSLFLILDGRGQTSPSEDSYLRMNQQGRNVNFVQDICSHLLNEGELGGGFSQREKTHMGWPKS